ncbi:MAG: DUF58 domain-containing protein [Armatimonadota bacterium]
MTIKRFPSHRLLFWFALSGLYWLLLPYQTQLAGLLFTVHLTALLTLGILEARRMKPLGQLQVDRELPKLFLVGEWQNVTIRFVWTKPIHVGLIILDVLPDGYDGSTEGKLVLGEQTHQQYTYKVRAVERGRGQFGNIHLRAVAGIGLFTWQIEVPAVAEVKAYPDFAMSFDQVEWHIRKAQTIAGMRRRSQRGEGVEFDRLRDYIPDDSPRWIDWKATARRHKITSREYTVERAQNIVVAIDAGRTMFTRVRMSDGSPGVSKFDCALNALVMLTQVAARNDDRVGMLCFGRKLIARIPPGKGVDQTRRFVEALFDVQPTRDESDYNMGIMHLGKLSQRRALLFLFSDIYDAMSSRRVIEAVGRLAKRHLVVFVALNDYELNELLDSRPEQVDDCFQQAAALTSIGWRTEALRRMEAMGVIVIDATPADLAAKTLSRYVSLKQQGRL